jgi:hypothetical protein
MADQQETGWREVDPALVEKQFKEYQEKNSRQMSEKFPKGRSVQRCLPPRADRPATPFEETWLHFIHKPDPDGEGDLVTVGECALKTGKGTECAGCKWVKWLKANGFLDQAKNDVAKWHAFASFLRLDAEKPSAEEPKVIDVPHGVFQKLNRMFTEKVAMGGDFTHPEKGFDLVVNRDGEGLNTKYDVVPARAISPLRRTEVLKKLPDLKAVAGSMDQGMLKALLNGGEGAGEVAPAAEPAKQLEAAPEGSQPTAGGTWTHPGQGK